MAPGVEASTGPLDQCSANDVGTTIAVRKLSNLYNTTGQNPSAQKVIDHYTYALVSEGDLMEGVSAETDSLAGHLKLEK